MRSEKLFYYALHLVSQKFPHDVAFETVPMFVLTMALSRPFKQDRLALSQSFNVSLLQMSPDLDTSSVTSAGSLVGTVL